MSEAIEELSLSSWRTPLKPSIALSKAAKDHANDIGPKGLFGHEGSNGSTLSQRCLKYLAKSTGYFGENCSGGKNNPEDIVRQLIIDDQVPSRGHRKNIMNTEFRFIGVGYGEHSKYRYMCVQDFADIAVEK